MDMSVSPALLVDRVAQMREGAVEQQVQIQVLKEAMQTQASAATALLNAVPSPLPLADGGSVGTQVNALV
ncbi:MAG: putative motility protein [Burkholderiaceae bacterium]